MDFGAALVALKNGFTVKRQKWVELGFIYYDPFVVLFICDYGGTYELPAEDVLAEDWEVLDGNESVPTPVA